MVKNPEFEDLIDTKQYIEDLSKEKEGKKGDKRWLVFIDHTLFLNRMKADDVEDRILHYDPGVTAIEKTINKCPYRVPNISTRNTKRIIVNADCFHPLTPILARYTGCSQSCADDYCPYYCTGEKNCFCCNCTERDLNKAIALLFIDHAPQRLLHAKIWVKTLKG